MQHIGVASNAYHSSMEFTSVFLSQSNPCTHGFDPLDMVGPYSYNGDAAIGSAPAGAANNQPRRHHGDERNKRRLASNRESARRSRMRKQRCLDEMSSRVAQFRAVNQRLLVELNHVITEHARIVRENVQLREEASELQRKLNGMEVEEAEAAHITPEIA